VLVRRRAAIIGVDPVTGDTTAGVRLPEIQRVCGRRRGARPLYSIDDRPRRTIRQYADCRRDNLASLLADFRNKRKTFVGEELTIVQYVVAFRRLFCVVLSRRSRFDGGAIEATVSSRACDWLQPAMGVSR